MFSQSVLSTQSERSSTVELFTDFPRINHSRLPCALEKKTLSPMFIEQIRAFCRMQHTSLETTLLSTFLILLSRYTGKSELTVGIQRHFTSLLRFPAALAPDLSCAGLIKQVDTLFFQREQQYLMTQDENASAISVAFGVKRSVEHPLLPLHESIEVGVTMQEAGDQVHLYWEYDAGLFQTSTIERMAANYFVLLQAVVEEADCPLHALPMLCEEEQQMLAAFNRTAAPYPEQQAIHQLFEEQVDRDPHRIAIRFQDQEFTYGHVEMCANQLAYELRSRNYARQSLIGLLLDHGEQKIICILAVLKAGYAYVPIDPEYPQARIDYLLEDCQPALVITRDYLRERLATYAGEIYQLESEAEKIAAHPSTRVECTNTSEDVAYVIYTSGSTGKPKGTMLTHRGLSNQIMAATSVFEIHPQSRVLQFASFSFDASVDEIFLALLNGACLILASADKLRDPEELTHLLERERVSFVIFSPSILSQLQPDGVRHLECLVSGGEACPSTLAERWRTVTHFVNGYGPTEATVCATAWSARGEDPVPNPLPIGKPLANYEIYLLDAHLHPVPIGACGEIYIAGPGLALGYLRRPELTRERFLPHPCKRDAYMYKTGDFGRFLPDGNLVFLGRADDQVKVRGYRIELQEIEAALLVHASIREAAVVAKHDKSGEMQLVAYVVPQVRIEKSVIWNHLRATLPGYMLPGHLLFLSQFPLSANGKVDRRALPEPEELLDQITAYVAPVTSLQRTLVEIWQEVLNIKRVGIHDHFFEMGGHSLKAARVASAMRSKLGVQSSPNEIFRHPTIASLAQKIAGTTETLAEEEQIPRLPQQTQYELSHVQRSLWHFVQLEPEKALYNIPLSMRLLGNLNEEFFCSALQIVVDRHEILRSTIVMKDGQPVQVVQQHRPVGVAELDWTHKSDLEKEQLLQQLQRAEGLRILDLEQGELFRAYLIRLHPHEHLFLFNVHHIAFDGWSTYLLLEELDKIYTCLITQRSSFDLPSLAIQYTDFAAWHNRLIATDGLQEQRAYWLTHLQEPLEFLHLPTDFPRPPMLSYRGDSVSHELAAEVVAGLYRLCQEHAVTPYMVLLSVFQIFLYQMSSQQDVIIGMPVAGRTRHETEHLIGMFVNTLALRARLSGQQSFVEVLMRAKETILSHLEHQDYPFDRLVEELAPHRSPNHHPIFSVMVAQEDLQLKETVGDLSAIPLDPPILTSKFDLTLFLAEKVKGISLKIEYATDLFEASTIKRWLTNLEEMLSGVLTSPQATIASLPVYSRQEHGDQLLDLPASPALSANSQCIHQRFEAQAQRQPGAVALRFRDQRLSYAELNARANQVAHTLRACGVTVGTPVMLFLPRSLEMIVSILGVVKAGGFYIPADPEYPDGRVRYMLEDSHAEMIITHTTLRHRLPATWGGAILTVDGDADAISQAPIDAPTLLGRPEDLLYLIYTSGSTGKPKGVQITHANLGRLFDVTERHFHFGPQDIWTMFHSYCFDFSVWEMYGALLYGGCLVIVEQETARSATQFLDLLYREQVTVLNQTPSAFYRLIEADQNDTRASLQTSLRAVIFGGEALQVQQLRPWMDRYGERPQLVNMYGITETTVHCTYRLMTRADLDVTWKGSPIGHPLADLQIYLLNEQRLPVPQGAVGELYVAGPGLARGYLNDPGKTSQTFISHRFPEQVEKLLYKSGDLARYASHGELEYLGRSDQQVKIRGYRIEIGEIENALAQQDGVRNCAVMVRPDRQGENLLVAYIETEKARSVSEWRALLGHLLPEYMIPASIVSLDRLPLTSNGKIDRALLPEPASMAVSTAYVPASTSTEQALVGIWQELLAVDRVGIDDNFFELGGHSLNAAQLLNLINNQFGAQITYRDIFSHPTIRELAQLLPASEEGKDVRYAFDLSLGEEIATFYLTKEEYETQGVPPEAFNLRAL